MYAHELKLFAFHHESAHLLTDPLPADRFAEQPAAGVNHPAWIVGHLAIAADFGLKFCGARTVCPAGWSGLFAPGTTPKADPGLYPPKAELLAVYDLAHDRLTAAVPHADPAALTGPQPLAFLRPHIATVGDLLSHILSTHEAFHLGQLSTWRRVLGFPSVRG
jgi:hypothetical protein